MVDVLQRTNILAHGATMANKGNPDQKVGWLHTIGLILLTLFLIISVLVWISQYFLFSKGFTPTTLTTPDTQILQQKLTLLGVPLSLTTDTNSQNTSTSPPAGLSFTTAELNALVAKATDLSTKMRITLEREDAIATLLLPLPANLPLVGGKQLKVNAEITTTLHNNQPALVLKNARVWGIPVSTAWLNGLQTIPFSQQFGGTPQAWLTALDRINQAQVKDHHLQLSLKP